MKRYRWTLWCAWGVVAGVGALVVADAVFALYIGMWSPRWGVGGAMVRLLVLYAVVLGGLALPVGLINGRVAPVNAMQRLIRLKVALWVRLRGRGACPRLGRVYVPDTGLALHVELRGLPKEHAVLLSDSRMPRWVGVQAVDLIGHHADEGVALVRLVLGERAGVGGGEVQFGWRPTPLRMVGGEQASRGGQLRWSARLATVEIGRYIDPEIGLEHPYRLPLFGSHAFVCGGTGSGKSSSFLWPIVRAIEPALSAGTAVLWVADAKAVDFTMTEPIADRYADTPSGIRDMLLELVAEMERRRALAKAESQRTGTPVRKLEPSEEFPAIFCIIDEFLYVTKLAGPEEADAGEDDGGKRRRPGSDRREHMQRLKTAVDTLIVVGRAFGIVLVIATQEPRKEGFDSRDLIPTRVAMRLAGGGMRLVLGDAWEDAKAVGVSIAADQPGVGLAVSEDGTVRRVQFDYVSDVEIVALCQRVAAARGLIAGSMASVARLADFRGEAPA